MAQGIVATDIPLKNPESLFIGGQWIRPESGGLIDVVNAATEEIYMQVGAAEGSEIDRAVDAARYAFDHGPWPKMTHAERADYLNRMGAALDERVEDVAQMWPREVGTTYALAHGFTSTIGGVYRYYADLADTFEFEERIDNPPSGGRLALVVREPAGVVGAIIPWNASIQIMAYKIAPALLAGCTVVLKASPESPGEALVMGEIAEAIGLPAGVLNVVVADRGPSERLVRNPKVDKITFTGSLVAGRKIAGVAAERIARLTLELGGKSAAVVLDDFDLESVAQSLAGSTCMISGQVCSSITRVVVPRSRHDELVEALSSAFAALKVGDPFQEDTNMGPVATQGHLEKVKGYIQQGIADGATLAYGGQRPAHLDRGWFIEPTLFSNVDNQSTVAQEEIFGPVLSVIPADNEEHAIELANDTIFGLNNSVFTNDIDRAYDVARQLKSGTVGHNSFRSDMSVGFGGFKQSGLGREGGVDGLRPFLENKTIILDDVPSHVRD